MRIGKSGCVVSDWLRREGGRERNGQTRVRERGGGNIEEVYINNNKSISRSSSIGIFSCKAADSLIILCTHDIIR